MRLKINYKGEKKMATPKTSILTKLYYATTLDAVSKSQVLYVQEIPALEEAAEAITYNALEFESERQEQGTKTASQITIPVLYQESQHDALKTLSDAKTELYWFIRYPDATATVSGDPLVKYFTGTCNLVGDAITIGEMLQETLTIYRSSDVEESKDFPTGSSI
jgi:hypothetical protein